MRSPVSIYQKSSLLDFITEINKLQFSISFVLPLRYHKLIINEKDSACIILAVFKSRLLTGE